MHNINSFSLKLAAFDLDGTLLNDKKKVSQTDYNTLIDLASKNVIRVAATGRNLLSLNRVLSDDFPLDYAVVSSGAGIIKWPEQEIVAKKGIVKLQVKQIIDVFKKYKLNFTIHSAIPNSHMMQLHVENSKASDLQNYTSFYKDYVSVFNDDLIPEESTQVIGLLNGDRHLYDELKCELSQFKCILTTSPVDNKSFWIEVFNINVSKANGLKWIMEKEHIKKEHTFSIGNDFNDIDMLNYTRESYVVSNANPELLNLFPKSISNNESGFTKALQQLGQV